MIVLYILLGCPWLFDKRVTHDGFRYAFEKDGKKVVSKPMSHVEIRTTHFEINQPKKGVY